VDDLKISHKDEKIVKSIINKLEKKYGKMTVVKCKKQVYVGMHIEYDNTDGTVDINMKEYLQEAIDEFPEIIDKIVTSPAANHLFDVNELCKKLDKSIKKRVAL
jgi:hypothetical protein